MPQFGTKQVRALNDAGEVLLVCCPGVYSRLSVVIKAGVELDLSRIQSLVLLLGTGSSILCGTCSLVSHFQFALWVFSEFMIRSPWHVRNILSSAGNSGKWFTVYIMYVNDV